MVGEKILHLGSVVKFVVQDRKDETRVGRLVDYVIDPYALRALGSSDISLVARTHK